MGHSGKMRIKDEIVHSEYTESKKHFYRMKRIIMKGDSAPVNFDFRKEDDDKTISDEAKVKREATLLKKVILLKALQDSK